MRRLRSAGLAALCLVSAGTAVAPAAGQEVEARVLVGSPWAKDDTVGDAFRPNGDLRRVVIDNTRGKITFTFRLVAAPIWDTLDTNRATVMRFRLDWRGTTAAYDRQVSVSRSDGEWRTVVHDGAGGARCVRQSGGVQVLSNHRYRFSVSTICLGGARVVRVASTFRDDQAADATDDIKKDFVPDNRGYGPFIRLP